GCALAGLAYVGAGVGQVEFTVIHSSRCAMLERETQVAKRLISLIAWSLHPQRDLVCLHILARKHQFAQFLKVLGSLIIIGIVWLARPERIFVELQHLLCNSAMDHRPKVSIAHWASPQPLRSWLTIP